LSFHHNINDGEKENIAEHQNCLYRSDIQCPYEFCRAQLERWFQFVADSRHQSPSTIGVDTLFRSKGKIPEAFLRRCGVPDALISYLPSPIGSMSPIQFYSCFISYSSKNREFAERLFADLQAKGVRCWYDQEHLKIGEKFRHHIEDAIQAYDKLMVVLSEDSIASNWVETEVEIAIERERNEKRTVLFPIRVDDMILKTPVAWASHVRRQRHIGDFTAWKDHDAYQHSFARLLRDLNASESTGTGDHASP
jgi:TIR domain